VTVDVPLLASNSHIDWWAGGAGAVIGAIIGSFIGSFVPLWSATSRRREESLGEIAAMHVEFHLTHIALTELLEPAAQTVLAPLYRLPITICKQALPKLIGDNVLTQAEVATLIEYVNRVEEINRGLERAGEAHAADRHAQLLQEHGRNRAKAAELINRPVVRDGKALFDLGRDALFRLEDCLRAPWWARWVSRTHTFMTWRRLS
jgi:hypothetical protein